MMRGVIEQIVQAEAREEERKREQEEERRGYLREQEEYERKKKAVEAELKKQYADILREN